MKQNFKKILCLILSVLFLLLAVSCAKEEKRIEEPKETSSVTDKAEDNKIPAKGLWKDALYLEDTTFGEGKKTVQVEVVAEERSVTFTLNTDKETLADALLEHKLAEGEDGPYGLYIKKVNGILADYNVDQSYWSFCKNEQAQMAGVSDTKIQGGEHFELVYTK